MGLEPRQRVCLVVQRSLPMTVAILAILKAGCQYVPLDGQVTAETALCHIMKDTKAPFILCLEKFYSKIQRLAEPTTKIVVLDSFLEEPASTMRPDLHVSQSDGAYAIYTSGEVFPEHVDLVWPCYRKHRSTQGSGCITWERRQPFEQLPRKLKHQTGNTCCATFIDLLRYGYVLWLSTEG